MFGGCDTTSYLNDVYSYDIGKYCKCSSMTINKLLEREFWQYVIIDDYSIPPTPRMMQGAVVVGDR